MTGFIRWQPGFIRGLIDFNARWMKPVPQQMKPVRRWMTPVHLVLYFHKIGSLFINVHIFLCFYAQKGRITPLWYPYTACSFKIDTVKYWTIPLNSFRVSRQLQTVAYCQGNWRQLQTVIQLQTVSDHRRYVCSCLVISNTTPWLGSAQTMACRSEEDHGKKGSRQLGKSWKVSRYFLYFSFF